ncbi:MAG: CHASE2 domain-containing protein [Cyanobacteria bacterium J06649_4]
MSFHVSYDGKTVDQPIPIDSVNHKKKKWRTDGDTFSFYKQLHERYSADNTTRNTDSASQKMDNDSNQILLNYRVRPTVDDTAIKIPLQKLLNGQVNPESIRDRMMIIGIVESSGDYWAKPYGVQGQAKHQLTQKRKGGWSVQ